MNYRFLYEIMIAIQPFSVELDNNLYKFWPCNMAMSGERKT